VLTTALPPKSRTAPLVTDTLELDAPSPAMLPSLRVPALIVVPPVKVFIPERISTFDPILVNAPEPLTIPPSVISPLELPIDEADAKLIAPA
jgi:hypothetical protein